MAAADLRWPHGLLRGHHYDRRHLVLAVDHTFVYTGAVRKIRELIAEGGIGDLYYYDSVRVNLGLFQHDVNVIWDLAVHDLAVIDFVLGLQPRAVGDLPHGGASLVSMAAGLGILQSINIRQTRAAW